MKGKKSVLYDNIRSGFNKAIDSFARAVVKHRLWFVIAFAVLMIAGIVCFFFVKTNYDSTSYLPKNSEIKQGLSVMYDEFGEGGNASVMISKKNNGEKISISYGDCCEFKEKIILVDGVASVMWLDDLFNGIIPAGEEYSQNEYAEGALLFLAFAEKSELIKLASDPTISAMTENVDVSDPDSIAALVESIIELYKDEYYEAYSLNSYSFDKDEGVLVIKSLIKVVLSGDISFDEFDFSGIGELIAGFGASINMFYSAGKGGAYSPLYQVSFVENDYSQNTMSAIKKIRSLSKDNGYDVHMSGNAATTYNSIDCVEKQTLYALIAVGIVVLIILFIFSTSFWEPILYLIAIGVAVVINMGSNVVMGSVSYLTSGVAGILQLALSMDYSIFILTRFRQEKEKTTDVEEAMINAVKASLSPISASSLTTIASFVAIMFMTYSIGLDMGIVFAKGVLLSLLSVFMLLPGLAVYTNKWIEKSEHKSFKLTFRKFTKVIMKGRIIIPIVAVLIIITACVGQYFMKFGYGDTATFGSKGSLIYEDKQEIEGAFGSQNQLAVLISHDAAEREIQADGGNTSTAGNMIINEFTEKKYVITAQSYGVIKESGMSSLLPDAFLVQFYNGGKYERIVTYLDLPEEGEETEKAIKEMRGILTKYGVNDDEYYMLGGSSSAIEIKDIVNVDYRTITWISVALIMIILFFTFRNCILPFLLVFVIEGAVWISMSISVLTGDVIVFLGYLIVSAVMLGATIDYGILFTSNYLEARKTEWKFTAAETAMGKSTRAILTSSIILCVAGIVITLTSTMPAIVVFGELIARAAACSLILVLGLLPCLLVLFDKFIEKTTIGKKEFFHETEMPDKKEKEDAEVSE